jgi:DNA-binding transcriptional regulator GbsR (MarR family)
MALEDFLGETSEIKIIDFLADNMDRSYNQTEISENTGLSRTTVNAKIPQLILNNIVIVDREVGKFKTFKLAENDIVKFLISTSLAHSFKQAENPLDDKEQLKQIFSRVGEICSNDRLSMESTDIIEMPIDGTLTLNRQSAKKLSSMLDKALKHKGSSV